jgi:hypothetical protein
MWLPCALVAHSHISTVYMDLAPACCSPDARLQHCIPQFYAAEIPHHQPLTSCCACMLQWSMCIATDSMRIDRSLSADMLQAGGQSGYRSVLQGPSPVIVALAFLTFKTPSRM